MSEEKKIKVKVHTRASKAKVVHETDILDVYVTEIPENGKANAAVIKLLAKEFKTAKSNIFIVSGLSSRIKTIVYKN